MKKSGIAWMKYGLGEIRYILMAKSHDEGKDKIYGKKIVSQIDERFDHFSIRFILAGTC